MNKSALDAFISENEVVISDGATGTNLIARGLPNGVTAEHWVLENPDAIMQLHRDFVESGSQIILTSTFGASAIRLKHAGLEDRFREVNSKAVQLAKNAAEGSDVLVAGSIGPLGEMLKPLGLVEVEDAQKFYADQANILVLEGVDLIVIETQFDITEAQAAVEGVRSVSDIGLICSFSFDRGTKTMMGVSPSKFAQAMDSYDLSALGINCGKSLEDNRNCLEELREATHLPIWYKPNAGLPEINNEGKAVYSLTPEQMGAAAKEWPRLGANFIGGCCGTSPLHLKHITDNVK